MDSRQRMQLLIPTIQHRRPIHHHHSMKRQQAHQYPPLHTTLTPTKSMKTLTVAMIMTTKTTRTLLQRNRVAPATSNAAHTTRAVRRAVKRRRRWHASSPRSCNTPPRHRWRTRCSVRCVDWWWRVSA